MHVSYYVLCNFLNYHCITAKHIAKLKTLNSPKILWYVIDLDLYFLRSFMCCDLCLCWTLPASSASVAKPAFLSLSHRTMSSYSHTELCLEQTWTNWLYPLAKFRGLTDRTDTRRWKRISLSICMSWSQGASHGACLESIEQGLEAVGVSALWTGADWRGAGHCAFRQVGEGSGVNW